MKRRRHDGRSIYCTHCGRLMLDNYEPARSEMSTVVVEKTCKCGTKVYYQKDVTPNMVFLQY
ncbi:hypothetical protein [Paludibacter sp. 221]|uniref:hypothetical protein n=1 Tax=Paludibacter sp. 221 TaxID=2302939 RepID=UPI0013D71019|nr:hypothetical protein [Paludibacter sp. 221]